MQTFHFYLQVQLTVGRKGVGWQLGVYERGMEAMGVDAVTPLGQGIPMWSATQVSQS